MEQDSVSKNKQTNNPQRPDREGLLQNVLTPDGHEAAMRGLDKPKRRPAGEALQILMYQFTETVLQQQRRSAKQEERSLSLLTTQRLDFFFFFF